MRRLDLRQTGSSKTAGPVLRQERYSRGVGQRMLRVRHKNSVARPNKKFDWGDAEKDGSGAPAITDLLGGQVQVIFSPVQAESSAV